MADFNSKYTGAQIEAKLDEVNEKLPLSGGNLNGILSFRGKRHFGVCPIFLGYTIKEFVILTKIPFESTIMNTVRISGYAYGTKAVVDFTLSWYQYRRTTDNSWYFLMPSMTSMSSWHPTIKLSAYTSDAKRYVAISCSTEIYCPCFNVDYFKDHTAAPGAENNWTLIYKKSSDGEESIIPQDEVVTVSYKSICTNIDGTAEKANKDASGNVITTTYATKTEVSGKVDKVAGKELSTNDYTTAEKSKLANIEAGAQKNVQPDWNATSGSGQILNKPTIPASVTETTVSGWGFTKNTGTYTKPSGGIPATDFTQSVQTILNNAITQYATQANWTTSPYPLKATDIYAILDTAFGNVYIKPNNGIPLTDLAQAVQTKINGALQEEQFLDFLGALNDIIAELAALNPYVLPEGGIPATDLDTSVQASLTKADNALTSHQSIKTINGQSLVGTGNITLETGGQVTVDTQMSSTSTNAVQNKVIKGYVDDSLEGVEDLVDAVLGTPSGAVDVTHFTVGSGLEVVNGVLQCSFVPTRYYTGSSAPINSQGNNGDLYFQLD